MNTAESSIEFQFDFTDCNGMMQLIENGVELIPNNDGRLTIVRQIQWPTTIEFSITGKDVSGTLLNDQGAIIRDRSIRLTHIRIDNLIPNVNFLNRWPILIMTGKQSNQIINSNYFGFNGLVRFEFLAKSAMHFMIKTNQFRDDLWNKN